MGHPAEDKKHFTVEEYLQYEEESEFRNEFYKGELFPIEATTRKHNKIVNNIMRTFVPHFEPKGCEAFSENVKLEVIKGVYYPYPDVMMSCEPDDNDALLIKKPVIIIEVLSPSTAAYDKGFKWVQYRKIASLRYYLVISQDEVMVEMYSRKDGTSLWSFQYFTNIQNIIHFEYLDFELPLSSIYEYVAFDTVA